MRRWILHAKIFVSSVQADNVFMKNTMKCKPIISLRKVEFDLDLDNSFAIILKTNTKGVKRKKITNVHLKTDEKALTS